MMAPMFEEWKTMAQEMTGAVWYIGLRAASAFREQKGRYPGDDPQATAAQLQADTQLLSKLAAEIAAQRFNVTWQPGFDKVAAEITRYGAQEIHTVSSFVGGVASQEAVKPPFECQPITS